VDKQLSALPAQQIVYAAASEFKQMAAFRPAKGCRAVHVLRRGDIKQPAAPAAPGGLACIGRAAAPLTLANPPTKERGGQHWRSGSQTRRMC